ncbi:Cytochrome oxidase Cu insertion factor, SCO1/SenC/PrrC family [Rubritalea squalenifaciens DSM 18772]|uniref:Cytochrome oxidase Cu insertion factor, SCO1/SenC/PrrC family n=1 Tax=Rubritalea squalenifaciens DSM 18772 TaxID=1123071 RepID=A0A1M6M3I3_9BACT|nr:hypothetical protein [Rubritalea squalenifaciens]SHJ77967.1 Cytochrome oxidase Cu insertion factor, SCO1/SenC/PrrC family [Rubritalea squalenifaciens DSM 18772]
MKATELEPAERDPKAIRRTVIILIILMIGGGSLIWWKYQQSEKEKMVEVEKGRSPIIGRLTSNFKAIAQDGKARDLFQLEGKLWVVAPIVASQPEENEVVFREMKRLADHYKDEERFHLVCLSVEDPNKVGYEKLAEVADKVGADIDRWWFLAADQKEIRGYMKDNLKIGLVTEHKGDDIQKYGKLDVPAKLRIVDQSRRLRGKVEHYDFDIAKNIELRTRDEIAKDPELAKRPESAVYLNMTQEFQKRMVKVIDYTLEEKESDKDPDYKTALLVVIAIVLFIIIQGIRLRKRVNG